MLWGYFEGPPVFPKISIVTPSYRHASLIEATMQSVLSQGYPNLEYIVIDGAGDDTADILRRYDDRLAYWCSEPDGGQYDAINKGFARATGDVLCWLNSDDMLLPKSLFVVGEIFACFPDLQWASTLRPGSWDANGYLSAVGTTPGFDKRAFLDGLFLRGTRSRGHWIQQESTFFRRSLWEQVGGKIPDHGLAGDFALWCAFYEHADLVGIDYPLAGFRFIEGQRSNAMTDYMREASGALDTMRKANNWKPTRRSDVLYSRAARIPRIGDMLADRFGYRGTKIINKNTSKPGAEWTKVSHSFLP